MRSWINPPRREWCDGGIGNAWVTSLRVPQSLGFVRLELRLAPARTRQPNGVSANAGRGGDGKKPQITPISPIEEPEGRDRTSPDFRYSGAMGKGCFWKRGRFWPKVATTSASGFRLVCAALIGECSSVCGDWPGFSLFQ